LGRDDLFGKGHKVPRAKQENRDALYSAYEAVCAVKGVRPEGRIETLVKFALDAEFGKQDQERLEQESKKKKQDRMRDTDGKFVSSETGKGNPPPRGATEEEVHEQLVSNVASYLKEQGVQMW
jgi:hypothetical protein